MNNSETHIERLCAAIERTAGFKMRTPANFEKLSEIILQRHHVQVSGMTLKRLWGYAGLSANPRQFTLDILANFVGYKDYAAFVEADSADDLQSHLFLSGALTSDAMSVGDRLLLTWNPDRQCVVEHLGGGSFVIREAQNTKLSVGDTFDCHLFINYEPLYIDNLWHNGMPTVGYVAGRRDGVVVRIIEGK